MLLRSGIVIAVFTLLSRIFGLCRELFIAVIFGTSANADAVNVAFKLPNLFRRIFGEGALASIFVPMFSEKLTHSEQMAEKFASKVFFLLLVILIALTAIIQYFMPSLMFIIAPGFHIDHAKYELTVLLCRITMPYLIFISLVALIGGMLNSIGKFAAFAAVPIIMNIVIIVGTLLLRGYTSSVEAMAWSVILAGILQLLFMFMCLLKTHLRIQKPHLVHDDPDIKKLLKLMVPATISSGVTQVNLFISQSIASFIPGAVSILSYADRIYQVPMSIIGVTFGTVLLPTLSKLYKSGDIKQAVKTQNNAIKLGIALSVPFSVAMIVLATPIIKVIYQHGAFTADDTMHTAQTIAAFAWGVPAFILSKILMPIFYANQDPKTAMRITIYTIIANIILNIILMQPFEYVGIAMGSSIAAWYNVYLFVKYAKSHGYFNVTSDLWDVVRKIVISGILASLVMLLSYELLLLIFVSAHILYEIVYLLGALMCGFTVYTVMMFKYNIFDMQILRNLLRK